MRPGLLSLAAALCVLAAVGPARADVIEGARFIRVKEGYFPPEGPGALAVARIGGWFWHCAGSYISADGYVLTASHCATLPGAQRSWDGPELQGYSLPARATLFREAPGPWVDGRRSTLVAAGRGWVSGRSVLVDLSAYADVPGVAQRLRELASGDWAILRVERDRPGPCAAVSERAPRPGETVTAFGLPVPAQRPDGHSSDGGSLKMTSGVLTSGLERSEWLATLNPATKALMIQVYDPAIRDGDVLVGDQDGIGGMSGGPVFAASSEQLAVTTAGGSDGDKYRAYSSAGVTIKKIFADLRAVGQDPGSYFSCRP